jgi:hypothetical protein
MPAFTPAAENPLGKQTPPFWIFIMEGNLVIYLLLCLIKIIVLQIMALVL